MQGGSISTVSFETKSICISAAFNVVMFICHLMKWYEGIGIEGRLLGGFSKYDSMCDVGENVWIWARLQGNKNNTSTLHNFPSVKESTQKNQSTHL